MTKEEYVEQLNKLTYYDQEVSHAEADDLLVAALRDAGWGEVADAYEKAQDRVGFWYA